MIGALGKRQQVLRPSQQMPKIEAVGLLRRTDLYIYVVDKPRCTGLNETFVEKLRTAVRSVHVERYPLGRVGTLS